MLLDAVIIVLREVLEAALIISVLLTSNLLFGESRRWVGPAIAAGTLLSLLQAWQLGWISEQFDGRGQEFAFAALMLTVALCLVWRAADLVLRPRRVMLARFYGVPLAVAVAFAISREGAEIFIYAYAFTARADSVFNVILGCAIGAGIGVSVGVLCYYLLTMLDRRWLPAVMTSVLTLIAAGMLAQTVMNLMQAGVIASQLPLWDSSGLIAETSMLGQLLYALIGYEATPTPYQVAAYAGIIVLVVMLALIRGRCRRR